MKEEIKSSAIKPSDGPVAPVLKATTSKLKKTSATRACKDTEGDKWVEVIPHGLVGGMVPHLCLMIFKEKGGSKRFAVSLSRLQGQISVQQSINKEEPFRFVGNLLGAMKVRIEKCYFLKCAQGSISVQVILSGHPAVRSMNLNANDVIPLAVYSGCRFYCTDQFMADMLDQKMERPLKRDFMRRPAYMN